MSEPTTSQLIAAAVYVVPALLWATMAQQTWSYLLYRHPRHLLFRLLPAATGAIALYFAAGVVWALLPPELHANSTSLENALARASIIVALAGVALLRHVQRLVPPQAAAPTSGWLVFNYVPTALVAAVVAAPEALPGLTDHQRWFATHAIWVGWTIVLGTLSMYQARHRARGAPSGWGPGGRADVRRPDFVIIAVTLFVGVLGSFLLLPWHRRIAPSLAQVSFEATLGLFGAVPIAVRMLGPLVRKFAIGTLLAGAIGAVWAAHVGLAARTGGGFHPLIDVVTLAVIALVLGLGHIWLREQADRLISGRNRRRREALHTSLHDLSLDRGVIACCQDALGEAASILGLRGAAILLGDGRAVTHGSFDVEPLRRVWPRGEAGDALPRGAFGTAEMLDLPLDLQEALGEANVGLGVFPIISPRARWGHLFLSASLLDATFASDDLEALEGFVYRLALVLDGADLLARALDMERSLAHAEKLAAIGEMAARIAHQIRNPVTAARSLAQQLSREPGSPYAIEHGLILGELERVEQQVRDLLRFARREEFDFRSVDLGALLGETMQEFRARLDERSIAISLAVDKDVVVRADAVKTRQVFASLIENAVDALADQRGERRLCIELAANNGCGRLEVADNGPGIPQTALPRLFEPFFSLKPTGTGLGLAIAKRIVDAHEGRLTVANGPRGGAVFTVELPAAREESSRRSGR